MARVHWVAIFYREPWRRGDALDRPLLRRLLIPPADRHGSGAGTAAVGRQAWGP